MLKADKPFIEAMRQATQLVRTQGARAATQFLQNLFRPQTPPSRSGDTAGVVDAVEVVDEVVDRRPSVDLPAELPSASGQFIAARFAGEAGARTYKLYVPSSYVGEQMPLLVMLHGCTQDPEDFALGTRSNRWAEARQFLVAYPQQVQRANSHRCWNWFRPQDQVTGSGEAALIAGIARKVMNEYRVDARRVYVAGLSAGGAMADVLGQAYPELFAAIGVHSGLPAGVAQNVGSALELMRSGGGMQLTPRTDAHRHAVPMIVVHGNADRTVHPLNGQRLVELAAGAYRPVDGLPLRTEVIDVERTAGSHAYRRTRYSGAEGVSIEHWEIDGAGHAWSGGEQAGSHTDEHGPDASRAMFDFFTQHAAGVNGSARPN